MQLDLDGPPAKGRPVSKIYDVDGSELGVQAHPSTTNAAGETRPGIAIWLHVDDPLVLHPSDAYKLGMELLAFYNRVGLGE